MTSRTGKAATRMALALMLAAGLASGAANAAFIDQGGGVVLDTTTNLEWEQNANHGPFNWAGSVAYGTNLALDGGGWHLATLAELQALYADLLGAGACTAANCSGSIAGFSAIQSGFYWSATEQVPGSRAFIFRLSNGVTSTDPEGASTTFAWAVRAGDVAAVPEPASLLLAGIGMLGLGWSCRRGGARAA